MKIIFDSEEQKEKLLCELAKVDICPSFLEINDTCNVGESLDFKHCKKCWEIAIECEIKK